VNDPTSSARLNVCCTSARPLPITSGSTIDTTPTAANTSGTRHSTPRWEGEGEHAVIIEEYRDRFITLIKAIDLTPDSARYGDILEIR